MSKSWVLVLAAGESRRFGGIKALAPWRDSTLLAQALLTAHIVAGPRVMVATGAHHDALLKHLTKTKHVHNKDWMQGMGSSISCGVAAIQQADAEAQIIIILPVDQPLADAKHLQQLVDLAKMENRIAFTCGDDVVGPPAAVPLAFFSAALLLKGHQGLKALITEDNSVFANNATALLDIDTPIDLESMQARLSVCMMT